MNDKNCNHKFFGSKLNTVLLLVLIALLGVTIYLIKQNKIETIFDRQVIQNEEQKNSDDTEEQKQKSPKLLLKLCPDEKISNQMPTSVMPGEPEPVKDYYIYKSARYEIADFDSGWVSANCNIKEMVVY